MKTVRILADDLTGALDCGAPFAGNGRHLPTFWDTSLISVDDESFSIDTGTRERSESEAVARIEALAPLLRGAEIGIMKIDSLLRGHIAAEVMACMRGGGFEKCILVPAFPDQCRVTRYGRQIVTDDDGFQRLVGGDIAAQLVARGMSVAVAGNADAIVDLDAEIILCDSETNKEIARIVSVGRSLGGRLLWCGTAAIAAALTDVPEYPAPPVSGHPLIIIGSDHPVSQSQLERFVSWTGGSHFLVDGSGANIASAIDSALELGPALLSVELSTGLGRSVAAREIEISLVPILVAVDVPPRVITAGGETLAMVCRAVGADRLDLIGQIMPGVPVSVLLGGAWTGLTIVSKSGAFGDPDLLVRLCGND